MQFPLEIHYRDGLQASPSIERTIAKHAHGLERRHDGILRCRVSIEIPHRHQRRGRRFRVRVDVVIPGRVLEACNAHEQDAGHEDVYVAIRDAFRACRRQLRDHTRIRRHLVKSPAGPPHGTISQLWHYDGYGFITTPDGREIYFDARSVIGSFEQLDIGQEVRFAEEMGDEGPQASSLVAVGKNSHRLSRPSAA